ncbi:MAG TPA: hypothetical protein VNF75_03070, partial [Candidatus Dormibacteraeota bacterium]|nr:hypothetical protein [Candidatus Dormibacteraeota bacterium]
GRVEQLAEQITAGVLPHMGRTWRWRVALVAAVVAGLLAGAVVGLLQSPREEPVTSGSRHPVRRPASVG